MNCLTEQLHVFNFIGILPWELWETRGNLIESMQDVLANHIYPRHTVWTPDSGFFEKKSKFREDMSNQQIQDAIAHAICYPSYEFTAYQIKDSYNKGYRIYKR